MVENNSQPASIEKTTSKSEKYVFGISINVLLMGFVSLFTDVSSEMITAIMPLFILTVASTNAIMALGFIDGISNAVANIIKGFSGYLSDKLKQRKAFVILGYSISNIAKPFIGLQTDWRAIMGLKVLDRVGKGIRVAPRDALISYYADKSMIDSADGQTKSGLNFGIHRTMDTMGAVIGAFLAAVLLFIGQSFSQVILWSLLPGTIAIIILFFVNDVKENDILSQKAMMQQQIQPKSTSLTVPPIPKVKNTNETPVPDRLTPQTKRLLLILSIMEFASVDMAFVMVRAADILESAWIIVLYGVFNIVSAFLATPIGKKTDKIGKQRTISIGLSVLLAISFLLALPIEKSSIGVIIAIAIFPAFGIYMSIVETGAKAFVSDITGKNKKGKVYGLYYLLVGALSIPESLLFAYLYQNFGYTLAFGFSTVLLAVCIAIFAKADFSKANS